MADIVLIHAFPLTAAMWHEQRVVLERAGHRVCAPDLPGFGDEAMLASTSIDEYARFVLGEMDAAGMRSALVCGLSMGGYIALRMVAHDRSRVASLLLADTRAEADTAAARAARLQSIASIKTQGTTAFMAQLLPKLLSTSATSDVVAQVQKLMSQAKNSGVVAALGAMAERQDATAVLKSILQPCAVVVGAEDVLTTPTEMHRMAELLPHAHWVQLQGGHLSNLESPAAFNQVLLQLLECM